MEIVAVTPGLLRSNCCSPESHLPLKISREIPFEMKVLYMRFVGSMGMQKRVKIIFPPRDLRTSLQINGVDVNPSEGISRNLNRHRTDALMYESMYVNTDGIKMSGTHVPFEIQMEGEGPAVVWGALRRKVGPLGDGSGGCMWVLECQQGEIRDSSGGGGGGGLVDVYFAGTSSGRPVLLNGVVELRKTSKDSDGHYKEVEERLKKEFEGSIDGNPQCPSGEDDGGEVLWFNAGVRVGVGMGLGMCLGVGVGLGLVVRTYKATSGAIKRLI